MSSSKGTYRVIISLAAPDPPRKEGLVKLCIKKLVLPEFGQLQSDCSISKGSRLVLTSGKLIAKRQWRKWTQKPIISLALGRNTVIPSIFHPFKWIWLNRSWHSTYVTCNGIQSKFLTKNFLHTVLLDPLFLEGQAP